MSQGVGLGRFVERNGGNSTRFGLGLSIAIFSYMNKAPGTIEDWAGAWTCSWDMCEDWGGENYQIGSRSWGSSSWRSSSACSAGDRLTFSLCQTGLNSSASSMRRCASGDRLTWSSRQTGSRGSTMSSSGRKQRNVRLQSIPLGHAPQNP